MSQSVGILIVGLDADGMVFRAHSSNGRSSGHDFVLVVLHLCSYGLQHEDSLPLRLERIIPHVLDVHNEDRHNDVDQVVGASKHEEGN